MKILVSAYACETGRGGEGEIGWRLVHELAREHDVRVITRANLRAVHSASFAEASQQASPRFEYFDLPWIFRFYKKGNRFFLLYYYLWQIGVAFRARRMLREEPADVLHHLIGGMDWMPSGLALCSGPFVWGPVGSEDTHPLILRYLPAKSRLKEAGRRAVRWVMRTLDPFTRLTGARAGVVLSHTPETLPARLAPKAQAFTQTGITDHPSLAHPKYDVARAACLRLVYAGELKDWKGAHMALDGALKAFERGVEAKLTVIGDGPLRAELEAVALAHPQGHRVRFMGKIPMDRLVETLHGSDLMIYPTFHHGLATIVLQAMLTRLPIICIEGDAIGRAVGQEAGITVPLSPDEVPAEGLARAIAELAEDEPRRAVLAHAAREIALKRYSYNVLAGRVSEIYRDLASLQHRKGVPDA
ncbi:MAG: glycosyltransferase family 4 protein [Parvibaculum sp.]